MCGSCPLSWETDVCWDRSIPARAGAASWPRQLLLILINNFRLPAWGGGILLFFLPSTTTPRRYTDTTAYNFTLTPPPFARVRPLLLAPLKEPTWSVVHTSALGCGADVPKTRPGGGWLSDQ